MDVLAYLRFIWATLLFTRWVKLTDLFNDGIDASEKIELLETKHHLLLTDSIKKEVANMCKYTTAIAEKNVQIGIEKGTQETMNLFERLASGEKEASLLDAGYAASEIKRASLILHSIKLN